MLFSLVNILDDDEYLIIHPAENKGFLVKASGVATTSQLQGLLQSLLIGMLLEFALLVMSRSWTVRHTDAKATNGSHGGWLWSASVLF